MDEPRWEHGSEFHWLAVTPPVARTPSPWDEDSIYVRTGRDALRMLMHYGQRFHGWRRLRVPSYFCQTVVADLVRDPLPVATYPCNPYGTRRPLNSNGFRTGDVVLVVNYFGLGGRPMDFAGAAIDIVEDHTHDPWSQWAWASLARYCVASLRKTLPIPDGAVLWSPQNRISTLLEPPAVAADPSGKLSAMLLKSLYLYGHDVEKDRFRRLATSGEKELGIGGPCAMSDLTSALMAVVPIDSWRRQRRQNFDTFLLLTRDIPGFRVLEPNSMEDVPFSAVLCFDKPQVASSVRRFLIDRRVYPAILWTLESPAVDGIPDEDKSLSSKLLSIHCDMRYSPGDMETVAGLLRAAVAQAA